MKNISKTNNKSHARIVNAIAWATLMIVAGFWMRHAAVSNATFLLIQNFLIAGWFMLHSKLRK